MCVTNSCWEHHAEYKMHYVRLNAPFTVTQKLAILSVILSCSFALTNPLGIVKSRSPWLSKATTVAQATLPSLTPAWTERLVCTFHDIMDNMYEVCRGNQENVHRSSFTSNCQGIFYIISQKHADPHILFLFIWRTRCSVLFSHQGWQQSTARARIKPQTHAKWNTSLSHVQPEVHRSPHSFPPHLKD